VSKKKKPGQIESTLNCRATAELQVQVNKELEEQDKSLGELLDEDKKDDDEDGSCECGGDC